MTEKEMFLNMIRRVLEKTAVDEDLRNYYRETENSVTIINANLDETIFYFNKNGDLIFYE